MYKKKYGIHTNGKAFTLVELLAVIVILAIILAIAIPGISGIISSATKGALESDAKMILTQLDYEKLADDDFIATSIDETNIGSINISNDNYADLRVGYIGDELYVIIEGKNKWAGLKACGTKKDVQVVPVIDTTTCQSIPVGVYSRQPGNVSSTCNPSTLPGACLSEIRLFAFSNYVPEGYLNCNGQILNTASYANLFGLISNYYGGNGTTTFQLPNLTTQLPVAGTMYAMASGGTSPNWTYSAPVSSGNYNYFYYQASNPNYLIGEIRLAKDVNEADGKMLRCDGRLVQPNSYPALFSLIGTAYGGNGMTTFALPNLSSATSPVEGAQYYIVVNGTYPTRP